MDVAAALLLHGALLGWVAWQLAHEPAPAVGIRASALLGGYASHPRVAAWLVRLGPRDDLGLVVGLAIAAACAWAGAQLVDELGEGSLEPFDLGLAAFVAGRRWPDAVRIAEGLAIAGGPAATGVLTAGTGLLLAHRGRFRAAAALPVGFATTQAVTFLVKGLLARPRPGGVDVYHPLGDAFPSGHTSGTAFAALAVVWVGTRFRPRGQRGAAVVAAGLAIALVAGSRALLAVHWLSDLAGGAALGTGIATLAILVARGDPGGCRRASVAADPPG